MKRPSRKAWLALCAVLLGCSSVVDFDRSKIERQDEDGGAEDGAVDMDGTLVDGRVPDAAPQDGTVADATVDSQADATPGACSNSDQCGPNELCCESECRPTTVATQCSSCNVGCGATSADTCADRACRCGSEPECSGANRFCVAGAGGSSCAECRDATDCAVRTDGKMQCVAGVCAACDPDDNSGCSGNTPICSAATLTCVACTASPNNCPDPLRCTPSGACGGCATSAEDCSTPTTPICDSTTTQCRGCNGNPECLAEMGRPYCIANTRCSPCLPETEAGCTVTSGRPDCRINETTNQYECQACTTSTHCQHVTGRPICQPASGRCVECTTSAECAADPSKPFCDTTDGTCKPCSAAGAAANEDNAWCAALSAARPACNASGRCVPCNDDGTGCTGMLGQCLVAAGAPQNNSCVDCTNNAGCSAPNDICNTASHLCVDCDPATNAGCAVGQFCLPGAPPVCVQCRTSADCGVGVNNACRLSDHTCVDCVGNADCGDAVSDPQGLCTTNTCNTATNTCAYTPLATIDDGLPCTTDSCAPLTGVVTHASTCVNDAFSCTAPSTCTTAGCTAQTPDSTMCPAATACMTPSTCTGVGATAPTGCTPSVPVTCDDGGVCDTDSGMCPP